MILSLWTSVSYGQEADSLIKKDFTPSGIRFGLDLVSPVLSAVDDSYGGWELAADVDFYRYYLVVEAGQWQRNFSGTNDTYDNEGFYLRAGVDVNFLKRDPQKNMFFVGARYGVSNFTENLVIQSDDVWNDGTFIYSNVDTNATWVEAVGGLKVKMWEFLWLGYTARYKFALNTKETSTMKPHDVPGYGRTDKNVTWGFTYYVLLRVPFKK